MRMSSVASNLKDFKLLLWNRVACDLEQISQVKNCVQTESQTRTSKSQLSWEWVGLMFLTFGLQILRIDFQTKTRALQSASLMAKNRVHCKSKILRRHKVLLKTMKKPTLAERSKLMSVLKLSVNKRRKTKPSHKSARRIRQTIAHASTWVIPIISSRSGHHRCLSSRDSSQLAYLVATDSYLWDHLIHILRDLRNSDMKKIFWRSFKKAKRTNVSGEEETKKAMAQKDHVVLRGSLMSTQTILKMASHPKVAMGPMLADPDASFITHCYKNSVSMIWTTLIVVILSRTWARLFPQVLMN